MFVAPAAELRDGGDIGCARVLVADRGGEEFTEGFGSLVARGGDDRRPGPTFGLPGVFRFPSRSQNASKKVLPCPATLADPG